MKLRGVVAGGLIAWSASAAAQANPPVRDLPLPSAVSSFGLRLPTMPTGPGQLVEMSGGRVLIASSVGRRVFLVDSALAASTVVIDTILPFGTRQGAGLMRGVGDSVLYPIADFLAFEVIDPFGKWTRTRAMAYPRDAAYIGWPAFGPRVDPGGRVVYRGPATAVAAAGRERGGGMPLLVVLSDAPSDSAPILRGKLAPRPRLGFNEPSSGGAALMSGGTHAAPRIDTIAFVRTRVVQVSVVRDSATGRAFTKQIADIHQIVDGWTMLDDGTVAVVRGQDYRVEWYRPDGVVSRTPPVRPVRPLTIDDRIRLVATKRAMDDSIVAASGGAAVTSRGPPRAYPEPAELPEVQQPFDERFIVADREHRIWIRQAAPPLVPALIAPIYDVIDRNGNLVDRVRFPEGTTLLGFGKGVAYVSIESPGRTAALARIPIK